MSGRCGFTGGIIVRLKGGHERLRAVYLASLAAAPPGNGVPHSTLPSVEARGLSNARAVAAAEREREGALTEGQREAAPMFPMAR